MRPEAYDEALGKHLGESHVAFEPYSAAGQVGNEMSILREELSISSRHPQSQLRSGDSQIASPATSSASRFPKGPAMSYTAPSRQRYMRGTT